MSGSEFVIYGWIISTPVVRYKQTHAHDSTIEVCIHSIYIYTYICIRCTCVQLYVLRAGVGDGGSVPGRGGGLRDGDGVCAGVRMAEHTLFH